MKTAFERPNTVISVAQESTKPIEPTENSHIPAVLFYFLSALKLTAHHAKACSALRPFDEKVFSKHPWLPLLIQASPIRDSDYTATAGRTLKPVDFIEVQERLASQQGFSYRGLQNQSRDPRWRQWYTNMHEDWNRFSHHPDVLKVLIPYGNADVFCFHYQNCPGEKRLPKP